MRLCSTERSCVLVCTYKCSYEHVGFTLVTLFKYDCPLVKEYVHFYINNFYITRYLVLFYWRIMVNFLVNVLS